MRNLDPIDAKARLDLIAAAVEQAWGGRLPLSVRYSAAEYADTFVMQWAYGDDDDLGETVAPQ